MNITFLGPIGATFSHDAYTKLAEIHEAPRALYEASYTNCIPASCNEEILRLIALHGGYGAIAMETRAECRVTELVEAFIDLLNIYPLSSDCPFHVVGALQMNLHFSLMTRHHISKDVVRKIVAHSKSLGACKQHIKALGIQTTTVESNGEAARLVAESSEYSEAGALGPLSASEKYELKVVDSQFEDEEACTTFFLIAPKTHPIKLGNKNRVLIVFTVPHNPGTLVRALIPFMRHSLNMIQIHSAPKGKNIYHFALELEVDNYNLSVFGQAYKEFEKEVETHLCFGPFEVLGS